MIADIISLALISVAAERITEILVASKLVQPFRDILRDKNINSMSNYGLWWFLDSVFQCGYCMSVWVSISLSWLTPALINDNFYINYILMIFVVHGFANFYHVFFEYARRGRAKYFEVNLGYKRVNEDG